MNSLRILKILSQNKLKFYQFPKTPILRYYSSSAKAIQNHVYTEAEIEDIKKVFRSLPSYQLVESIEKEDLPKIYEAMNLPRSQKQLDLAFAFFENVCGGKLYMDDMVGLVQTEHDPVQHLMYYAKMVDKNKDGFISAEEYKVGVEMVNLWYPTAKTQNLKMDYEQFVKEADTNKDGRVSVEELGAWLVKNV